MTKARDLADRTAADITAVTAGTGISISSGAGPIPTVTNTVATGFDAKGDLIIGTGADTFTKLTVASTANAYLVVDSATTSGLKWASPVSASAVTLVSATTFSGVATHSVNNCFSSAYRYYRVLCDFTESVTTNRYLLMRLRASGTDSTANYNSVDIVGYNAVVGAETDPFGTDEILLTALGTSLVAGGLDITFLAPQIAAPTVYFFDAAGYFSASYFYYTGAGTHSASTSYDGFTIYTSADNISGTVKVYGYQD